MNRMLRSKCGDRKRELCQSDNVVASAGREINFNPDLYQMFQDISAKSPERIEGFRAKIHADIEAERAGFRIRIKCISSWIYFWTLAIKSR